MPVLVVNKQKSDTDLLEGVYALYKNWEGTPGSEFIGSIAEAIFYEIDNKDFIKGIQVNFLDGSGTMRYELWNSDEMLLIYHISNIGYRKLNALPIDNLTEMKEELIESVQAQYFTQEIYIYNTLEERNNI